jgi:hypothetical protein
LSAENINKIDAFLRRLRRFRYLSYEITLNDLIHKCVYDLYCKMCKPDHCLNHMLHTRQNSQHDLREHGHVFELPSCNTDVYKQIFIKKSFIQISLGLIVFLYVFSLFYLFFYVRVCRT